MTDLDERAQALWDQMKVLDTKMTELVAARQGIFQSYNEVLAQIRDRERDTQPKTKWDEALEEWVDATLGPNADVIPIRREEPDAS